MTKHAPLRLPACARIALGISLAISLAIAFSACLVAGCGGPPRANVHLTEARRAYASAVHVGSEAPSVPAALSDARDALDRAERAWSERQDVVGVEHYAYLVQQYARLAVEQTNLLRVEWAIRKARLARDRALGDLRRARDKAAAAPAVQAEERAPPPPRERAEPEPPVSEAGLGAVLTRRGLVLTLGDDAFAAGAVTLHPSAAPTVEAIARFLAKYPERRVQVEGFCDAAAGWAEALTFSQRRAERIREALIARGVAPGRVAAVGYGVAHPVASDETPEGRQQNRRVEVVISDIEGAIPPRE